MILLLTVISTSFAYAQQKPVWFTNDYYYTKSPLLIVCTTKDTIQTIYSNLINTISPDSIKSIVILKDTATANKYGEQGKNGVLIVETKPDYQFPADMITLKSLIKNYPKTLPLYVDSSYIMYPDMLYIKRSGIKKISEETEHITGAKYLNVLTTDGTYKAGNFILNKSANVNTGSSKSGEIMIH